MSIVARNLAAMGINKWVWILDVTRRLHSKSRGHPTWSGFARAGKSPGTREAPSRPVAAKNAATNGPQKLPP